MNTVPGYELLYATPHVLYVKINTVHVNHGNGPRGATSATAEPWRYGYEYVQKIILPGT